MASPPACLDLVVAKSMLGVADKSENLSLKTLIVAASPAIETLGFDVILVTAHNVLFGLQRLTGEDSQTGTFLQKLGQSTRNLLYAADLQILPGNLICVAAGTPTGKIFVWSVDFRSNKKDKVQIHYIFSLHQGSIFGLRFAPNFCFLGTEGALQPYLVSCSDDRTIKIWNVRNLYGPDIIDGSFPNITEAYKVTRATDENLLASATGHASRIWDTKFLEANPSGLSLLSIGEDATIQLWEFSNGPKSGRGGIKRYSLRHKQTFSFNSKRNIWSSAVSSAHSRAAEVLVGGADGKIVRYPISASKYQGRTESQILTNDSLIGFQRAQCSKDFLRDYDFLDDTTLIGVTNNGIILAVEISKEARIEAYLSKWFKIGQRDSLKWYSKMKCIREIGHACIVGVSGSIYIYNHILQRLSTLTTVEGKVGNLFVQYCDARHFSLLVTGVRSDTIHFFVVCWFSTKDVELRDIIPIQLPHLFIVTSSTFHFSEKRTSHLFLGGRNGSILLISLGDSDSGSRKLLSLVQLDDIHQGESVTALLLENRFTSINDGQDLGDKTGFRWLFSTGRDGNLAALKFDEVYNTDTVILSNRNGFNFGPHIEGMYRDTSSNSLFVYGFRGTEFVVYNEQLDQEILAVECGGAHRKWSFLPLTAKNPGKFAWTKSSSLHLRLVYKQSHDVLRTGGHGREIKAMAVSPNLRKSILGWPLIATGAEDTDIRLFAHSEEEQPQLKCLKVMKKHVTGVQGLQWCPTGQYLFSSGGFQEFFVWKINSIPLVSVGIICESACPLQSCDTGSRITGFSVKLLPDEANAIQLTTKLVYLIIMAYSDSGILMYRYEPVGLKWTQLQKTSYYNCCLTQLSILPLSAHHLLLGSAADGCLTFWPFGVQTRPITGKVTFSSGDDFNLAYAVSVGKIHESGIACTKCYLFNSSVALVATGGDDGTLALTLLDARGNPCSDIEKHSFPVVISTARIRGAHAASLSALIFLGRERMTAPRSDVQHSVHVLSCGNDQRLKLWKIDVDITIQGAKGVNVACIADIFTSVADVSSMALLKERNKSTSSVVIAGTGLDVWDIKDIK